MHSTANFLVEYNDIEIDQTNGYGFNRTEEEFEVLFRTDIWVL